MKVICGWCDIPMPDMPGSSNKISHGMCPECSQKFKSGKGYCEGCRKFVDPEYLKIGCCPDCLFEAVAVDPERVG